MKLIAYLGAVVLAAGCGSQGTREDVGEAEQAAVRCPRTGAIAVDAFKELLVVHPTVINDARASNATGGPWSFRFLVEQMAPPAWIPRSSCSPGCASGPSAPA
jgi:hypothetical protein